MPSASSKTRFIKSVSDPAEIPKKGLPQVVFLGRSNAGKSSLINALAGTKNLARVSAAPGRTRLINLFDVEGKYQLVDLPGYGFAKGSHTERQKLDDLIHGYLSNSPLLRYAVVIIDGRLGATTSDFEMIESLKLSRIPYLIVANKIDKLARSEASQKVAATRAAFPDITVIPHSSVTGVGRGELTDALRKMLDADLPPIPTPVPDIKLD